MGIEDVNGVPLDGDAVAAAQKIDQQQAVLLDNAVSVVIGTVIRGLSVGAPGVDPAALMNLIAWRVGHVMSNSFRVDDIATMTKLRGDMRKAFTDGLNSVPVTSRLAAPAAPAQDTRAFIDKIRRNGHG